MRASRLSPPRAAGLAKRSVARATKPLRPLTQEDAIYGPTVPFIIAIRSSRRGWRRDGTQINSPRTKPLFLHLLLVINDEPGFIPKKVWLDQIQLKLQDGWANNRKLCDKGVNLVYCQAFPRTVPARILAKCHDFLGQPRRGIKGRGSFLYLRLEWRERVFSQVPTVKVSGSL